MIKCLIVDAMHDSIHEILTDIGVNGNYQPNIDRNEILKIIGDYEGLIIRGKTQVDKELINMAKKLRFVARAGAGIDNMDVSELNSRGIKIINAPEGNQNAVSEQVIALILGLLNKIPKANREVRNSIWDREGNRGEELVSKTVGLLGYGYMGAAVAEKLRAFGCKVLVYDKYRTGFSHGQLEQVQMSRLFDEADIFSLHVPLTTETLGLVDDDYLSRFKKDIIFINTARGEIAKLTAIVNALESGKIRMAGLDVLENEKLDKLTEDQLNSFNYLTKSPKTILTPHVAGWTIESYKRINTVLGAKIAAEINEFML